MSLEICTRCGREFLTECDDYCIVHKNGLTVLECDCVKRQLKSDANADALVMDAYEEKTLSLQQQVEELKEFVIYVSELGPRNNTKKDTCCFVCDMGEAGYSSRGTGFHDDDCIVVKAQEHLAKYAKKE